MLQMTLLLGFALGTRPVSSFAPLRFRFAGVKTSFHHNVVGNFAAAPVKTFERGKDIRRLSRAELRKQIESDNFAANLSIKEALADGKLSRLRVIVDAQFRETLRLEKRRKTGRLFLEHEKAHSLEALRSELADYLSLPEDAFLLQVASEGHASRAAAGCLEEQQTQEVARANADESQQSTPPFLLLSSNKDLKAAWEVVAAAASTSSGVESPAETAPAALEQTSSSTPPPPPPPSPSSSSSPALSQSHPPHLQRPPPELRLFVRPNPAVEWPPVPPHLRNLPDPALTPSFQMLSFYSFEDVADPDAFAEALQASWAPLGALGRVYTSPEGVNAQMAVPSTSLSAFELACAAVFNHPAVPGNGDGDDGDELQPLGFELNLDFDVPVDEFRANPPFRALHVRSREQIVSDGLPTAAGAAGAGAPSPPLGHALDQDRAEVAAAASAAAAGAGAAAAASLVLDERNDALVGQALGPEEWHAALEEANGGEVKEKKEGAGAAAAAAAAAAEAAGALVVDCRNKYESDLGRFQGALPLNTTTFKDTWGSLERVLEGKPKDTKLLTYCTGGIRCVKVGAYLTQVMGFTNVKRLEGGIVNYTQHFRRKCELEQELEEEGAAASAGGDPCLLSTSPTSATTTTSTTTTTSSTSTSTTSSSSKSSKSSDNKNSGGGGKRFEDVSKFRGFNYVFNDRMAEVVTSDVPNPGSRDRRAVEARALVAKRLQQRAQGQSTRVGASGGGGVSDGGGGGGERGGSDTNNNDNDKSQAPGAAAPATDHTGSRPPHQQLLLGGEDPLEAYCGKQSSAEPPLLAELRLLTEATLPHASHMVSGHLQGRLLAMLTAMCGAKSVLEVGTFTGYSALCFAEGGASDVTTLEVDPAAAATAQEFFDRSEFGHRICLLQGPALDSLDRLRRGSSTLGGDASARHDILNQDQEPELGNQPPPPPPFDMVFLDADKRSYGKYLDLLLLDPDLDPDLNQDQEQELEQKGAEVAAAAPQPRQRMRLVRPGTVIVVDNVLWKGKVLGAMDTSGPSPGDGLGGTAAEDKAARRDRVLTQAMHEFNVKVRKDKRVEQVVLPLRDGLSIIRVLE